jgi:hypothetical protein
MLPDGARNEEYTHLRAVNDSPVFLLEHGVDFL